MNIPFPQGPWIMSSTLAPFLLRDATAFGKPVCRLGLASYAATAITAADIHHALDRGVNFLNWAGDEDVYSRTIAQLGPRREQVVVCVQFAARTAADADAELRSVLAALGSDYVDVLTFYYVEEHPEWQQIIGPGGALDYCREAQYAGQVRLIGLTSHQRPLDTRMARSGLLDLLMIRYNAAHRGAEVEIFPATDFLELPVVAYTCLRWGALLRATPDDPPGFAVPRAPAWYRFVLQHPSVSVALMAPDNRAELEEDLTVLDAPGPLAAEEYERLAEHGRRVKKHAGGFP
jgi:predicted aldo/keto reductase-like oxidoreductase